MVDKSPGAGEGGRKGERKGAKSMAVMREPADESTKQECSRRAALVKGKGVRGRLKGKV